MTVDVIVGYKSGKLTIRFANPYAADIVALKKIPHRRWRPKLGVWTLPANLDNARKLRQAYGRRMSLSPSMRDWALAEVRRERNLVKLRTATDANLKWVPPLIDMAIDGAPLDIPGLPKHHPFGRERDPRPYQRADIAFMAQGNCINANDVGVGKTLENVGAIFESQVYPQPLLIIAPKRSLVSVWKTELERFTDYAVHTSENPAERKGLIEGVIKTLHNLGYDRWALVLLADDIRLTKDRRKEDKKVKKERRKNDDDPLYACVDYQGNRYRYRSEVQRDLLGIKYGALIIDEFHDTGVNNRRSLFYNSAKLIQAERTWLDSATPIGGKARRLWPVLNFLYPKIYTSEWRWIEENLEVIPEKIYVRGGHGETQTVKKVGEIDDQEEFFNRHSKHIIRRSKLEALPGLPTEVEILVPTPMLTPQLKQYVEFDRAHEIILKAGKPYDKSGKRLTGSIVLTQYLRLRQIANSTLKWDQRFTKPIATTKSGKFEPLLELLAENGIRKIDFEPGARSYIGVAELSYADAVSEMLTRSGIDNALLTGKTIDSAPILSRFDDEGEKPFVIVMTIKTGGTGLNLERANSAHLLDEPWDPDQEHQFFGRGNRGSRTTPLRCYTYRTPDSIQEYVAEVVGQKKITNRNVLDFVPKIEKVKK